MFRIPLHLNIPISSWKRNVLETKVMQSVQNFLPANTSKKNIDLILHLQHGTDRYRKYATLQNKAYLKEATEMYEKKESAKALIVLHQIIICADDKSILKDALKLRAGIYKELHFHERAVMDYEMFLFINGDAECNSAHKELCGIIDSLIYLRNYRGAKKHLEKLEKLIFAQKAKILNLQVTDRGLYAEIQQEMIIRELRTNDFRQRIDDNINYNVELPKFADYYPGKPYQGYTPLYREIPHASVACSFIASSKINSDIILANRIIPINSIVAVERPINGEVKSLFTHCEQCLKVVVRFFYTCLQCHVKVYCSLDCMLSDVLHKYECNEYGNLLLILMDARNLYRILVKALLFLKKYILTDSKYRDIKSADQLLISIRLDVSKLNTPNTSIGNLLQMKCNYDKLFKEEYLAMITVAYRLGMYLPKIGLLKRIGINLSLPDDEITIFMSALLLQLQNQLAQCSSEFGFRAKDNDNENRPSVMHDILKTVCMPDNQRRVLDYYNISHSVLETEVTKMLNYVKARQCSSIKKKTWYRYPPKEHLNLVNAVAVLTFNDMFRNRLHVHSATMKNINSLIAAMNWEDTLTFMANVAYEYFLEVQKFPTLPHSQYSYLATLVTLPKFRHSCDPNVQVMLLSNGDIIAKTLREVKCGEELVVSMGPHIKHSLKAHRQAFLKQNHIECDCNFCTKLDNKDFIEMNGVKCPECNFMNESSASCSNCETDLEEYQRETGTIERHLQAFLYSLELSGGQKLFDVEKKIFETLMIAKRYTSLVFPIGDPTSYKLSLLIARCLAYKNFVEEAYEVIKWAIPVIDKTLLPMSQLMMTTYSTILDIMMIMILQNLNSNKLFVVKIYNVMNDIYTLATTIAKKQLVCYEFWEFYDSNFVRICEQLNCLNRQRYALLNLQLKETPYFKLMEESCLEFYRDTDILPDLVDPENEMTNMVEIPEQFFIARRITNDTNSSNNVTAYRRISYDSDISEEEMQLCQALSNQLCVQGDESNSDDDGGQQTNVIMNVMILSQSSDSSTDTADEGEECRESQDCGTI